MPKNQKIFGIGLSKTGTTTLYSALQVLGHRTATYRHMKNLGLSQWLSGDFSEDYLVQFNAATDLPIGTYFRELDQRYPGSKFILTLRPVDSWVSSIERQFKANPDPKGDMNRDVRMATYGVSTFNEERFRRVFLEHNAAVQDYFADRPDDFLTLDLFSGQGWDELCDFLNTPVPDVEFPSVKPGFKADYQPRPIHQGVPGGGCFAIIVPIVHPNGPKISDYNVVTRILRESVRSYLSQRHANTIVIVVCHEVPHWAEEVGERVKFINIGDHPTFGVGRNDVQTDKGLKYALGCLYAINVQGASLIMLGDGDDFVASNLASTAFSHLSLGMDGLIVTRGLNLLLKPANGQFDLYAAYKVFDFDKTCGTCRIIPADTLIDRFQRWNGEFLTISGSFEKQGQRNEIRVDRSLLSWLGELAEPIKHDENGIIRILGRHARLSAAFELTPLPEALVAKGCGHGNHDGPKKGEIHWNRVTGMKNRKNLLHEFGLTGGNVKLPAFPAREIVIGMWNSAKNKRKKRKSKRVDSKGKTLTQH